MKTKMILNMYMQIAIMNVIIIYHIFAGLEQKKSTAKLLSLQQCLYPINVVVFVVVVIVIIFHEN
jgi:hypothetical protein